MGRGGTQATNLKSRKADASAISAKPGADTASHRSPLGHANAGAKSAAPQNTDRRPPADAPPFSLADIRAAIPPHLFTRPLGTSLYYLVRDFVFIAALGAVAYGIDASFQLPWWASLLLWAAYAFVQGNSFTGLWIIAHECGHGAFSDYKSLNSVLGFVLHSALMVPYHSWRITHAAHHANTCSIEHDEAFSPDLRSRWDPLIPDETGSLVLMAMMLFLAWPIYFLVNLKGPVKYPKTLVSSHYNPWAPQFTRRQAPLVLLSDAGLLATFYAMWLAASSWGWIAVLKYYIAPLAVASAELVVITYLQHTDEYVPHYREAEFTWLRGALSTVDRSFGAYIDEAHHHISDSHVVHHLFHKVSAARCSMSACVTEVNINFSNYIH